MQRLTFVNVTVAFPLEVGELDMPEVGACVTDPVVVGAGLKSVVRVKVGTTTSELDGVSTDEVGAGTGVPEEAGAGALPGCRAAGTSGCLPESGVVESEHF